MVPIKVVPVKVFPNKVVLIKVVLIKELTLTLTQNHRKTGPQPLCFHAVTLESSKTGT